MVSFLKLRRQCGVSHEVRQGAQGASLMAPGKTGLHVRGEGVRVISIEPWKQIRASRHVEVGLSRSFSGAQGASHVAPGKSGLHVRGEGERVIALEPW